MSSRAPSTIRDEDLTDLYENAPCGYISADPSGRIVRVNQTFLNMTGHDRVKLLGGTVFAELMTVPGRVFYDTHFAPLMRIQGFVKEIACDLVRPGQAPLPVLINGVQVKDAEGKPLVVRFTVFDATERRRYEADLHGAKKRAEHYAAIVRVSADAIISYGPDGSVEAWNDAAERTFAVTSADAVGHKVWELVKPADGTAPFQAAMESLRAGRMAGFEGLFIARDDRRLDLSVTLTPHIEPPGEMTRVSAILRDITSRRRAEKFERRQELLQNILNFQEAERHRISRDLHDHLGQQATAIRLGLEGLKSMAPPGSEILKKVESIQEEALQMDRDMSFLAFELRPHVLSVMSLGEALENYIRRWSANYNVAVEFHELTAGLPKLAGNIETNLYRIAQEALNNAAKHARAENLNVILGSDSGDVTLIFEDDGVGFDPVSLSAGREEGGGLGLVGMRERAALLGGTLEIETSPGEGTTIFVRVPVSE